MKAISILLYFFSHHGAWGFFVLVLLGILLSWWRKKSAYILVGFLLAMANTFTSQFLNAWFLARFGESGSAIITASEQTNSTLNDQYIWEYNAVVRTADGRDIVTDFSTTTAATYPIRNAILIPPDSERFIVKYIPGFEKNIVIMVDESGYGKRRLHFENLKPVQKARKQFEASPGNGTFRKEYVQALQAFINDPVNAADTPAINECRAIIQELNAR